MALICFVLYLTNIFLSKIHILHCLVSLNSVLFILCLFRFTLELVLGLLVLGLFNNNNNNNNNNTIITLIYNNNINNNNNFDIYNINNNFYTYNNNQKL